MKKQNAELAAIESEIKTLQEKRSKIMTRVFEKEELPLLKAQVGKHFIFAGGSEVVKLTKFDEDEGYRVEEYTLQKQKGKVTRFVFAVYWKGWYPFYDIKTASPLGHGYKEITAKQYNDFKRLATTKAGSI